MRTLGGFRWQTNAKINPRKIGKKMSTLGGKQMLKQIREKWVKKMRR